ncbi:MAG: hypothetical protein CMM01_19750 [Rhodopirellula sp.]|nr:hypothetical protein [Rhodopirellula sp.]
MQHDREKKRKLRFRQLIILLSGLVETGHKAHFVSPALSVGVSLHSGAVRSLNIDKTKQTGLLSLAV